MKKPNYTQVPNDILDNLHAVTPAEAKVALVICRQTFGFHKESRVISLSQLESKTGLSRQGVINCVSGLLEKGWIIRRVSGDSFEYEIAFDPDENPPTEFTPKAKPVDHPPVKPVVPHIKKEIKKEKESVLPSELKLEGEPKRDIPEGLDTVEFKACWKEFEADRKERGKKMSTRARALILKRMDGWGPEKAVRAMQKSIECGWANVFEPLDVPPQKQLQPAQATPKYVRPPLEIYNPPGAERKSEAELIYDRLQAEKEARRGRA